MGTAVKVDADVSWVVRWIEYARTSTLTQGFKLSADTDTKMLFLL